VFARIDCVGDVEPVITLLYPSEPNDQVSVTLVLGRFDAGMPKKKKKKKKIVHRPRSIVRELIPCRPLSWRG